MKDLFTTIVEGPLGMFAEFMGSILTSTEALIPLLSVAVGYLTLMAARAAIATARLIGGAIASIFSGNALLGPAGILAAVAGTATMVGLIAAQSKIPGAQFGAKVMEKGDVLVGEAGPEVLKNVPEGAKITTLNVAERGDLKATQSPQPSLDLTPLINKFESFGRLLSEQQLAISQMKIVMYPNAVQIGEMSSFAQVQ